jgi:hypothetical protein
MGSNHLLVDDLAEPVSRDFPFLEIHLKGKPSASPVLIERVYVQRYYIEQLLHIRVQVHLFLDFLFLLFFSHAFLYRVKSCADSSPMLDDPPSSWKIRMIQGEVAGSKTM